MIPVVIPNPARRRKYVTPTSASHVISLVTPHPPSSSAASPIPAVKVSIIDNRQEIALKSATTTNNNIPIPPKLPIEIIKHIVEYVHEDTLPKFITVDKKLWNNETNERLNRRLVELTRRLQVSETLLCENRQRILHAMENMEDEEDI